MRSLSEAEREPVTCRDLSDFLMDYDSGELPETQKRLFEEHLDECPDCVRYLASYRATIKLGKSAFASDDAPVPSDVPEDLVAAVLAARRRKKKD